jgi:hypothetical protein
MNRVSPFILLLALVMPSAVFAQAKPKDLTWTHAFDLACRKYGEADFTEKTQKFGVEAFYDPNNKFGMFISQTGAIAIAGGFQTSVPGKGPDWVTGLDLPVRKTDEKEFSRTTKVWSLEVFRDPNTDNFLYITEKGEIATSAAKGKKGVGQQPKWSHGVDLNVRPGGEKDWGKAKKVSVEVYRDDGMGTLIYMSETGALAVVGHDGKEVKEGKAPDWLHGLDLACRASNEPSFSPTTKKWGIEVFRDVNTNNILFICESGVIAVAPGSPDLKAPTANVKEPVWTHGINMKCRSYGEKEFSEKTNVTGAEVFRDENVGITLAITEKGALSAAK